MNTTHSADWYIHRALAPDSESVTLAVYDREGNFAAAASFKAKPEGVKINFLGSREKGRGSELMRHILALAGARPITVLSENSAVGFYEKFGFRAVGIPGLSLTEMVRGVQ